ncbi:Hsp20 family protein, partial [Acidobacteria bacterium ACD]|nr:Hsp20 family protein [Acidobacteria bacterium ACD]
NVDAERVAASLNEGVLTIDVPKREEAKPKSIPIATGKKVIDAAKK